MHGGCILKRLDDDQLRCDTTRAAGSHSGDRRCGYRAMNARESIKVMVTP
jgi:hypothetical protein